MQRILKIQETGDFWKKKTTPVIRLNGKWLLEAGFRPGTKVIVDVKEGRLILTASGS